MLRDGALAPVIVLILALALTLTTEPGLGTPLRQELPSEMAVVQPALTLTLTLTLTHP